jgi:hypothetical protein
VRGCGGLAAAWMGGGLLLAAGCQVCQLVVLVMAVVLQHLLQRWQRWVWQASKVHAAAPSLLGYLLNELCTCASGVCCQSAMCTGKMFQQGAIPWRPR